MSLHHEPSIKKGLKFASFDPSNQQVIWEGYAADANDVDIAYKKARQALPTWSLLPIQKRIQHLEAYGKILSKKKSAFAHVISQETGKPLWDSEGEVTAMINKIAISIKAYEERCPERSMDHPQGISISRHKPHGVLAVFGPYNFPGHLPNGHIVPALLAGNTIIFKPSDLTPYVAELMTNYWHESGLPEGVLNLLQGGKDTGKSIAAHPKLDGLLFTGSWNTGSGLAQEFAKTPYKILALEMGGNNPLVVSQISHPTAAAYMTILSAFISSGQRCTCARRLILVESQKSDEFLNQLILMTQSIVVGAYNDDVEPFMGPVISPNAAQKLIEQQKKLLDSGGNSLITMSQLPQGPAYLNPGIIDMTYAKNRPDEEIFGPLLQIIRVKNLQEAIIEANTTAYGLTAGIFTDSEEEYQHFFTEVKAGVINWNVQLTGASSSMPFGGLGKSGNQRPSAFYAADYCAYPIASIENSVLEVPKNYTPGLPHDI